MKTTFIYALCEPGTRTVRYIGKANDPKKRFTQHLRVSRKLDSHLGHWLNLLMTLGGVPEMVVLREVEGDGSEAEMRYIRLARGCRMSLVNATDGGEGCQNPSPETRAKMGHRGEKNHMFGKTGALCPFFQETHPMFGKKQSPESNAKRSLSQSGENHYGFGGHLSEGHKATLSASLRNPSAETRAARAARNAATPKEKRPFFGKTHTPEANAKRSASLRAAWARRKEQDQEIERALSPYTLE